MSSALIIFQKVFHVQGVTELRWQQPRGGFDAENICSQCFVLEIERVKLNKQKYINISPCAQDILIVLVISAAQLTVSFNMCANALMLLW